MKKSLGSLLLVSLALVATSCGTCEGALTFADHPQFGGADCKGSIGGKLALSWSTPPVLSDRDAVRIELLETTNNAPKKKVELDLMVTNGNDRAVYVELDKLKIVIDGETWAAKGILRANRQEVRGQGSRKIPVAFELPRVAAAGIYHVELRDLEIDSSDGMKPLTAAIDFDVPVAGAAAAAAQ